MGRITQFFGSRKASGGGLGGVTMTLTGVEGFERTLMKLERRVGRKIGSRALRAAAKVVQAEAKRRAPIGKRGFIPPSIKVRAVKRSRKNKDYVGINVITAGGWFKGKTFYAAFLEFGHHVGKRMKAAARKVAGDTRQWVPPRPFIGPAYEATKGQARQIIIRELRRGIEAEAGKP